MALHRSNKEFNQLLDELGWSTGRCAISLGASPSTIQAWVEGRHPVPDRVMRMLRKHYEIANPGASAYQQHTPPPDESPNQNPRVDNPHMNWHGHESESHVGSPHTGKHLSLGGEIEQMSNKIHDLEDQLFRLKRSYRELSQENERLRKELGHKEEFGPYAILGVTPGSDWTAIKQAYIRLSQKHHPDKGGDEGQMQKITEAYTELKLIYS